MADIPEGKFCFLLTKRKTCRDNTNQTNDSCVLARHIKDLKTKTKHKNQKSPQPTQLPFAFELEEVTKLLRQHKNVTLFSEGMLATLG